MSAHLAADELPVTSSGPSQKVTSLSTLSTSLRHLHFTCSHHALIFHPKITDLSQNCEFLEKYQVYSSGTFSHSGTKPPPDSLLRCHQHSGHNLGHLRSTRARLMTSNDLELGQKNTSETEAFAPFQQSCSCSNPLANSQVTDLQNLQRI